MTVIVYSTDGEQPYDPENEMSVTALPGGVVLVHDDSDADDAVVRVIRDVLAAARRWPSARDVSGQPPLLSRRGW